MVKARWLAERGVGRRQCWAGGAVARWCGGRRAGLEVRWSAERGVGKRGAGRRWCGGRWCDRSAERGSGNFGTAPTKISHVQIA